MPFPRPSLTEQRAQVAADIDAALPGLEARFRYSNIGIIGDVQAAAAHGLYGYLDWIARQSVPFTATDEYLEGWAALAKVTRKPATKAYGTARFAATAGKSIAAGQPVTRSDGVAYVTTALANESGGHIDAPIRAMTGGADGNAPDATVLSLGIAISGVTGTGAAYGAIGGGIDVERDNELRSRMMEAFANPEQGGSITDYARWAREIPGVTRAWIQPSIQGLGTIGIFFMMDAAQAAHAGFPQGTNGCATYETRDTTATGDQLTVANAIFPRQTVQSVVYAVAPVANTLDFTIAGLTGASDATKAAIAAAIDAALYAGAAPGGIAYIGDIEAAIAGVTAAAGFVITAVTGSAGTVEHGGTGNIISNAGALPVRGTVTYA
ncbi:baseplate J/gp47 family protein [Sphingomonas aquatica]|uniref:baseplate J/gp47 family protein n=1 Tax=Sphingomonas aquatica TaxID=1763824 RepID=UPI00301CEA31